jgi:hypothetical protein
VLDSRSAEVKAVAFEELGLRWETALFKAVVGKLMLAYGRMLRSFRISFSAGTSYIQVVCDFH